jgi:hypothetical protein
MNGMHAAEPRLEEIRARALVVGAAGVAVCVLGMLFGRDGPFQGYLYGLAFWTFLSLGCLGLLMLHHLVGGGWGFTIQRVLEAGTRNFPVLAVLFVPLFLGLGHLYVWADPAAVAKDPLLQHKAAYLKPSFFVLRTIGYLAIWNALAFFLNRWSAELDRPGNERRAHSLEGLSGIGLLLFVLSVTFASFDWVMSLEAHWYSTIYGLVFVVGQGLAALAFSAIAIRHFARREPLAHVVGEQQFHDLGNLMLAFVMLWTYMSLSQFLITWSGNLPEEVPWYLRRTEGGWNLVSGMVILFHFVVPFLVLLSRGNKRNIEILAKVAAGLFAMRAVELLWQMMPGLPGAGFGTFVWFVVGFFGVGGLWLALFLQQVQSRPLLAEHDPRLGEAFEHHE